jgi:hypothetical protein
MRSCSVDMYRNLIEILYKLLYINCRASYTNSMNTPETIDALQGNGNQAARGKVASRRNAISAAGRSGGGQPGGRT